MEIPKANYVVDGRGQKLFVQLEVHDWERFVEEFQRIESLLAMKEKLKTAFRQVRQIRSGETTGTTFTDFLDEL
jgi:hypothetical protein